MSYARILAVAAIAVAALTGCSSGGSDANHGAALQSPLSAAEGASQASKNYIVKSSDTIYSQKAPRIVSYPVGRDNDEVSETGAGPVEPCEFVSHSRAAAILGGSVRTSEEPQGPTCVYKMRGSKRQVTLTVENIPLTSLRGHARKASRVQVAGHVGWCLRYEATSVAVPLTGGRVLHVTGACDVAARFAALAMPHVR